MKITTNTLNILKNFAKINPSILLVEGNTLKTISPNKTIMAKAKVDTTFVKRCAIYNLDRFIATISLFQDPELNFDEKSVKINGDNKKSDYYYADENTIKAPPDKEIKLPSVDVSFTLSSDDLDAVMKSAAVLGSPHIAVKSDGAKIVVAQLDNKDSSSHSSELEIAEGDGKKYNMVFKTEHLRMIPGSYTVSISFRGIASFKHTEKSIQYWIATEAGSTKE